MFFYMNGGGLTLKNPKCIFTYFFIYANMQRPLITSANFSPVRSKGEHTQCKIIQIRIKKKRKTVLRRLHQTLRAIANISE